MTSEPNPHTEVKDFDLEVERVERELCIGDEARAEADWAADTFGLEERERRLLAIELEFFRYGPTAENHRADYLAYYYKWGESLFFGQAALLNEDGWLMRWGATAESINQAMRMHRGSFSAEGVIGDAQRNTVFVIFHPKHEEVLDAHGYNVRKFGRV